MTETRLHDTTIVAGNNRELIVRERRAGLVIGLALGMFIAGLLLVAEIDQA